MEIRGIKARLLVDSGATDTILSSSVYYRINSTSRPDLTEVGVHNADGSSMDTLGSAWLELGLRTCIFPLEVVFGNTDQIDGLLGLDFMEPNGCNIDLKTKELLVKGERIKCTDARGVSFSSRVVVGATTRVPPGHEVVIPGHTTGMQEETGFALIEPAMSSELLHKGIIVARVVVERMGTTLPVRVFNPGKKACVIRRGTLAGHLTPISGADIEECHDNSSPTIDTQVVPEHLVDLFERSKEGIDQVFHGKIAKLLCENQDVFAISDSDIGKTGLVKHHINTGDSKPIRQRPRRFPPKEQEEIDRQIQDMLQHDRIEPSDSPWSSNVVLVKKKDGSKRFCVDYRRLNHLTIKDSYPIPRIDDSLDALGGAKWFSTLDLASGYWQVELDEEAKKKSAFVVRGGLYSWKVMPFGLCNAPSTFERLMEQVLAGLHWEVLLVYLDDVIVFAKTIDDELTRLGIVFQRLRQAGLKLKAKKCHLFRESVLYLGHVVSREGVATDPEKIRVVKEWPTPTNAKEVQSFLGLASYYRRFIAGFANIARPLHRLTGKSHTFAWSADCEDAFQELKKRLQESPILAYPDPKEEFILDTDASNEGIGAVLSQVINGKEKVISYASRALNKAEKNYCVTRKELLAVVVFLKQFRQYLYGQKITVSTDHGALQWLLNFRDPQGQMARWLQVIAEYDIKVIHRAGRSHANADSLSRRPCPQCKRDEDSASFEGRAGPRSDRAEAKAVTLVPSISNADLNQEQAEDSSIKWILEAKRQSKDRPDWSSMTSKPSIEKSYWRMWDQLAVKHEVLYRKWECDQGQEITWHVVLPTKLRSEVVKELHGGKSSGHLGMNKTIAKVRMRFYWVGMDADIRSIVRQCNICASKKSPAKKRRAPLQQDSVGMPMERVALDIVGPLPETERGNKYILVVGDYFSKWMEAYPIPDQTAETVAEKFVNEFVCRFGVPAVLHSDQGRNFESHVFKEMCEILGIHKTRTTPYNPKSDGLIEKFNGTLINMLSMMIEPFNRQRDWDEKLAMALLAYRSAPQDSTRETPNMLMLGREIHLPVDLTTEALQDDVDDGTNLKADYAYTLRQRMRAAHQRARANFAQSARRQKKTYDQKVEGRPFAVGEFVWLHNAAKTKGLSPKLQRRWEGPYLIVHRLSDVTCRIQAKKRGKMKVVHVDRLKPYIGEPPQSWLGVPLGQPSETQSGQEPHNQPGHHQQVEHLIDQPLHSQPGQNQEVMEDMTDEAADSPLESHQRVEDRIDQVMEEPGDSQTTRPRRNPPRKRNLPQRYKY